MAVASKAVTVRLDDAALTALQELRRRYGASQSEAVRRALLEASLRGRETVEQAVRRLATDPAYQQEVAEWQEFMEDPDDPW